MSEIVSAEDLYQISLEMGFGNPDGDVPNVINRIAAEYAIKKVTEIFDTGMELLSRSECESLLTAYQEGWEDCWNWVCQLHGKMGLDVEKKLRQMVVEKKV